MGYKTLVFAGPSAVGKTYIANELIQKYPERFDQAKLYTTRIPRTGESSQDREFVTAETFQTMVNNGAFVIHADFGGNSYGYTKDTLLPKNKHLLVNAWPWLIPQLGKMNHVIIVGMQAPKNWSTLLAQRMKARGDTQEVIEKRLSLIESDYLELNKNKDFVNRHGKFFVVQDDNTILDKIVPWIEEILSLEL